MGAATPAAASGGQQPEQQPAQAPPPPPPPPPPPYSQLSLPVYSLATAGPGGASPTMNLVTYASPISLQPRRYALGLYRGTLSWQNMLATRAGVLQILDERHAPLFELLGRTSGRDVDKLAELAARGVSLLPQQQCGAIAAPCDGAAASAASSGGVAPLLLLGDSSGWMELRIVGEPVQSGDHDVVICEVISWGTPERVAPAAAASAAADGAAAGKAAEQAAPGAGAAGGAPARPLYTGHLRQLGLM